jgi:hypothetical protein
MHCNALQLARSQATHHDLGGMKSLVELQIDITQRLQERNLKMLPQSSHSTDQLYLNTALFTIQQLWALVLPNTGQVKPEYL